MFDDKNTSAMTSNNDEFVIHTMSKDLEESRNPSAQPYASKMPASPEKTTTQSPNSIKTNPFLAVEKNYEKPIITKPTTTDQSLNIPIKTITTNSMNPFDVPATPNQITAASQPQANTQEKIVNLSLIHI